MIDTLVLAPQLRAQIAAEARNAFPRECCGLIEGTVSGTLAHALALHPCANLATAPDRFEIDPQTHIRLLRALREGPQRLIGCYHSHPNGTAAPSSRDIDGAGEEGFVWLIQAVERDHTAALAAYRVVQGGFAPLSLTP